MGPERALALLRRGQETLSDPSALALDVVRGSTWVTATTVSGDVTLRLPAGEAVHVKANAVSGRLVVDGEEYGGGMPGSRTVDLRHGESSGSTVSVSTVSGDVTLLRGATPSAANPGGSE